MKLDENEARTDDEFGILVRSIDKSKRRRIDVRLNEYKGTTFLDIREYYQDKETGQWRPGKKGIAVRDELYPELLQAIVEGGELLGFGEPDDD